MYFFNLYLISNTAYPFDLVHTRMTTDMSPRISKKLYQSVSDWLKKANSDSYITSMNSESIKLKHIYKGFHFALWSSLPYSILSLPLYTYISQKVSVIFQDQDDYTFSARAALKFLPSTAVLLLLSSILYPLDTAKKLWQINGSLGHNKAYNTSSEIFKKNSFSMLYKGYSLHVLKVIPYSFVQYSFYELCRNIFKNDD